MERSSKDNSEVIAQRESEQKCQAITPKEKWTKRTCRIFSYSNLGQGCGYKLEILAKGSLKERARIKI